MERDREGGGKRERVKVPAWGGRGGGEKWQVTLRSSGIWEKEEE
jgi:hypothetical protein